MARTILEIYDEMVAEKQTMTNLSALQPNIDSSQNFLNDVASASQVAGWRCLLFAIAFGIWTVEKLFDQHVAWINNRANEIITGTLPWYVRETLKFQYGDPVVWNGDRYQYATIDPTHQIVKLATANEAIGVITIKTATLDGSGQPTQLTSGELTALEEFWSKWKFGGVRVQVVSRPADLLKVYFKIYYDPLVLTASGELINTPGVFPVEDAINEYVKNLPFDGVYSTTALTDKIQNAAGVVDPVHLNSEKKFGVGAYSPLIDYYQANAGYLKIDPLFPLSVTTTYTSAS